MTALSILIPSRNEMFLNRTIESVLGAIEADTEIIVALDGQWPVEPVPDHERVRLIYFPESVGQRAATNAAARMSEARYVMKLDAHCSVGQGFDRIMMEDMQPDWTMVPLMHNLHAFDWVCQECGQRTYQGPTPDECGKCGGPVERDVLWKAKPSPKSTAMRFDRDLRFQYWGAYKKRQRGDLVDTMSILGACWMLERERYHELDICDEGHTSWGQQGTEVACKTWLSGGRLVCNTRTWFAHMFRTQGGDFGFPYPLSGRQVNKAREYSRRLWRADNPAKMPRWDKAAYPLSWLIEKFAPVPDWHDGKDREKAPATVAVPSAKVENSRLLKGIIYYTDNRLDPLLMRACQRNLERMGLPIVSVSLEPLNFGQNIVLDAERGALTMFRQMLAGLEASDAEVVFFAEHDIIYHESHYAFTPERANLYYYNQNSWRVDLETGKALFHYASSTSGLCARRELLLEHYRERVRRVEAKGFSRRMGFEPGTHGRKERVDDHKSDTWMSDGPNLDVRHGHCLTPTRWSRDQFRNQRYTRGWTVQDHVDGWYGPGGFKELLERLAGS